MKLVLSTFVSESVAAMCDPQIDAVYLFACAVNERHGKQELINTCRHPDSDIRLVAQSLLARISR